MADHGDALVALIRQIVREEIGAVTGTPTEFKYLSADDLVPEVCGARDPAPTGRICQKPVHRGRHLYTALPHAAPDNGWRDIEWFGLNSGSRHYVVKIGHPVKVKGFGRGGAAQPGWFVTSIQQRGDDINVGVRKDRTGPERTVKADKIVYMRPKKVSA